MISNLIDIAKRITYIREELNLTKEKFGTKFGVTGNAIYNIENTRNKALNIPLILSISAQYDISKDWLLYGTSEKYIKNKPYIESDLLLHTKLVIFFLVICHKTKPCIETQSKNNIVDAIKDRAVLCQYNNANKNYLPCDSSHEIVNLPENTKVLAVSKTGLASGLNSEALNISCYYYNKYNEYTELYIKEDDLKILY